MTKSRTLALFLLSILFSGCSSLDVKESKIPDADEASATPETRLVFGKLIDLNPDSIPGELKFTYILYDKKDGVFLIDNKFPNRDPELGYFWVAVPLEMHFFGVSSLRLGIRGHEGTAVFRDEESGQPILGVVLPEGKAPVYLGDITIRSFLKNVEAKTDPYEVLGFALKELSVKKDLKKAKADLLTRNMDPKTLLDKPLVVMNAHEVSSVRSK